MTARMMTAAEHALVDAHRAREREAFGDWLSCHLAEGQPADADAVEAWRDGVRFEAALRRESEDPIR